MGQLSGGHVPSKQNLMGLGFCVLAKRGKIPKEAARMIKALLEIIFATEVVE